MSLDGINREQLRNVKQVIVITDPQVVDANEQTEMRILAEQLLQSSGDQSVIAAMIRNSNTKGCLITLLQKVESHEPPQQ